MRNYILLLLFCASTIITIGQETNGMKYRLSTEAEYGFEPCYDTIKFLFFETIVDISRALPEWHPVIDHDENTILEGTVIPKPNTKNLGTHISSVDHPLYHYTHDFTFNIKPDSAYQHLLALRVFISEEEGEIIRDTVLQEYIHCEWENGLGGGNKGNPCSEVNCRGDSYGFFSAGHQRGDIIWNWPTFDDWVHIEGLWVWDRGHPPAYTEIHPVRLIGIRRNLPAKIELDSSTQVFATRIDIFANGDGGALYNNMNGVPDFVRPVRMRNKDYSFEVQPLLPRPSPDAQLRFLVNTQKGDSYTGNFNVHSILDSATNTITIQCEIPWKHLPDTVVFARTVFAFWDESNGKSEQVKINSYKVTLEDMRFKMRKEFISRSEWRIFLEVGGKWIFLNEFSKKGDILRRGYGKTMKRKRKINQSFIVHVPENTSFRVHVGGWEADGVDYSFGILMDQYSPCTQETKKFLRKNISKISPFALRGCMDDFIGAIYAIHNFEELKEGGEFKAFASGELGEDICLLSNGIIEKAFWLKYRIEKIP